MKALTLTEPWATLVMLGAKRYETRSWNTRYRGQLIIHAAKGFPKRARELINEEPFQAALDGYGVHKPFQLGHVLGSVQLLDICPTEDFEGWPSDDWEIACGDFHPGRWAWKLSNPIWLPTSLHRRGSLGLWECSL